MDIQKHQQNLTDSDIGQTDELNDSSSVKIGRNGVQIGWNIGAVMVVVGLGFYVSAVVAPISGAQARTAAVVEANSAAIQKISETLAALDKAVGIELSSVSGKQLSNFDKIVHVENGVTDVVSSKCEAVERLLMAKIGELSDRISRSEAGTRGRPGECGQQRGASK